LSGRTDEADETDISDITVDHTESAVNSADVLPLPRLHAADVLLLDGSTLRAC
jgi:hypothetical protein